MLFKVKPREDALIGPLMSRTAIQIQRTLQAFLVDKDPQMFGLENALVGILSPALVSAVERGYSLVIAARKAKSDNGKLSALKRSARARAKVAAKQIAKTTKKAITVQAMSRKDAGSKDRADKIVDFEVPKIMFLGMRKGIDRVSGTRMPKKSWLTSSDNPCENCQMNEDEGSIDIDEVFPSGDFEPPMHLHCDCVLGLYI